MSPQIRDVRFTNPKPQRGAIGLVAALTLGLVALFMLLVVDSGRLYLEQRTLQRVADLAVLEAVSRGGNCVSGTAPTYANQSAIRNAFTPSAIQTVSTTCGTVVTGADKMRTFSPDATKSDAVRVITTTVVPTSVAGGLWNLFAKGTFAFNTQLTASAVGVLPRGLLAQLTLRNTVTTVTSSQSTLLNDLWGGLLGGTLNLSVSGWQGLVDSQINVLSYLNQLALDLKLTAGSYTDVLNTNIKATQLIDSAIKVLTANGATTTAALDGLRGLRAAVGNTQLTLGDIVKLQTGSASAGLDAPLNVFQLAEAFVQLANIKNGAAATIPLSIPGILNGGVKVKIIEPPQLSALGDPAKAKANPTSPDSQIYVRTAQVRAAVTLNLPVLDTPAVRLVFTNLVGPLSNTLNNLLNLNLAGTLESVLCAVALPCKKIDLQIFSGSTTINALIEVGSADSYVTDYSCAQNKTLTATTRAPLVTVKVGAIDMNNAFSSSSNVPVAPLALVDIGSVTCSGLILSKVCDPKTRVAFFGGGIGLKVDTTVAGMANTPAPYTYVQPPNVKQPPLYHSQKNATLVASLKDTLNNIQLQVYKPTGSSALGSVLVVPGDLLTGLTTAITTLVGGLLSSIVDPIIDRVLNLLGINLNEVDVGANLTCGQGGRAQLVL